MRSKFVTVLVLVMATILVISSCLNKNSHDNLPDKVSYNFHIRPILSDKCFKCHGPDANKRQGQFRLDIPDSAFAPLKETKGAFALVPGKPAESELYKRISSTDTSYMMPAPESHLGALSQYEIKLFKKWIEQGAHYETHWAFRPPEKEPLPKINNKEWAKNEIDYFILKKLDEKIYLPMKKPIKNVY